MTSQVEAVVKRRKGQEEDGTFEVEVAAKRRNGEEEEEERGKEERQEGCK